jgi:hypothetical protein
MTCPSGAITSFPLQLAITATDTLYDSVSEPITMDFQWSSRSTPPTFYDTATSTTDEVGVGNTNLTTLRFMNNSYTIYAVQLIKPSHTSWILPSTAQANNKEDIAITFSCSNTNTPYNYLTFIIPILRTGSSMAPSYLKGLSDPNSTGPFSIQSCFPTNANAQFAFYSTCLSGYAEKANTSNIYIFVSTSGIQVSSDLMDKIVASSGKPSGFGSYSPPFVSRLTNVKTTVGSNEDFMNYVMTTNELLNYAKFKETYKAINETIRTDDISSYTCVAMDPDTAVVDGKLNIDLKTGELSLADVMEQRDALRAAHGLSKSLDPGRLEAFLGTALGIMLSVILVFVLLYFVFAYISGVDPNSNDSWIFYMPKYVLIILFAGLAGFLTGSMV